MGGVLTGAFFGQVGCFCEEMVGESCGQIGEDGSGIEPGLPLNEDLLADKGVVPGRIDSRNGSDANQQFDIRGNGSSKAAAGVFELRGETIFGISSEFPRFRIDRAAAVGGEMGFQVRTESITTPVRAAKRNRERASQKPVAKEVESQPIQDAVAQSGTNNKVFSAQEMVKELR